MPVNYGIADVLSISEALADETIGVSLDARGASDIVVYITGKGTVSSGILTIEENTPSGISNGSGWSSVTTVDFGSVSVTAGATAAVHLVSAAYSIVRPRISTVIGGTGTITVRLVAQ